MSSWGIGRNILEESRALARSLGAASRAEILARQLGLNVQSLTTRQLLSHLDMQVSEFISTFRQAGIRAEFPAEFLQMSIEEALRSRHPTVRKLLIDRRFAQ